MTIREITPVKYWYENKYIAWEIGLFNGPNIQITRSAQYFIESEVIL